MSSILCNLFGHVYHDPDISYTIQSGKLGSIKIIQKVCSRCGKTSIGVDAASNFTRQNLIESFKGGTDNGDHIQEERSSEVSLRGDSSKG